MPCPIPLPSFRLFLSPPQPSGFTCIALPSVPFPPATSPHQRCTSHTRPRPLAYGKMNGVLTPSTLLILRGFPKMNTLMPAHILLSKGSQFTLVCDCYHVDAMVETLYLLFTTGAAFIQCHLGLLGAHDTTCESSSYLPSWLVSQITHRCIYTSKDSPCSYAHTRTHARTHARMRTGKHRLKYA